MDNLLPILFFVLGAVCMYALMKWKKHRRQKHKLKNAVTPNFVVNENIVLEGCTASEDAQAYLETPDGQRQIATLQIKRDEKGRFVSLKQSRN